MQKGRAPHTETTRQIMERTGERLAALAEIYGNSPTEIEKAFQLTRGHWRLMIRGERPLSPDLAARICEIWGITLDWLYRGIPGSSVEADVLVNLVRLYPDLTETRSMSTETPRNSSNADNATPTSNLTGRTAVARRGTA